MLSTPLQATNPGFMVFVCLFSILLTRVPLAISAVYHFRKRDSDHVRKLCEQKKLDQDKVSLFISAMSAITLVALLPWDIDRLWNIPWLTNFSVLFLLCELFGGFVYWQSGKLA